MPRLPSSQRVIVDVIEWYAHSVFLEDSNELDIFNAAEQLDTLCRFAIPELQRSGRIWNRIILVNLVHNICTRKTTADEAEALIHLGPQDWETMLESLEACRASLIKVNADTYPPEGYDKEDQDMVQLPMFNEVYHEVHDLLHCHLVVAQFRQSLKTSSCDDIHSIIEQYTQNLPKCFQDTDLVRALRKDVLSSPTLKHNVVEKILRGVLEQLQTTGKSHSYDQVQRKVKRLARVWNESILGIPTLVKLGYGGIRLCQTDATGGGDDTKTVSSFGLDEEELEKATATAARRKQSKSGDEGDGNEGSEEYYSANEGADDDDDAGPVDGRNVFRKRKMKATVGSTKGHEVQPLEIRPRQSWKDDYSLINDLAKMRKDDDSAFPAGDDGNDEKNDTNTSKGNLIIGSKTVWTDSDDDDDESRKKEDAEDADTDDEDEADYHKTAAQHKLERRQRRERRKAADLELHKRFLETDDDEMEDPILDGSSRHPTRPMVVKKRKSSKRVPVLAVPRYPFSDDSFSSEDENLPPFLRSIQISPKLPTYAEHMQRKKEIAAAAAALKEQDAPPQQATSAKKKTRATVASASIEKETPRTRKKRRLHFLNKKPPPPPTDKIVKV